MKATAIATNIASAIALCAFLLTTTGANAQSSPSAQDVPPSFAARLKARVRPNIDYTVHGSKDDPEVVVEIGTEPDGTIVSRKIISVSGDPSWGRAVLRALDKTQVLPRDPNGNIPRVLTLSFRIRD